MLYITFLLTLVLLIVLGLYSLATGTGPAALKPVQDPLKPVTGGLRNAVGVAGIVAVIWGVYGVITFIVDIQAISYVFFPAFMGLLTSLVLITVGCLAGYVSVAAFFGAPASGAGKFIDWFKRTFGANESIVGLVALLFAIWILVEFILNRSGVVI